MDLLYFTARTVIVVLVVTLALVFAFLVVADDIEDLIARRIARIKFDAIARLEDPRFWSLAAKGISQLAYSKMDFPADQKQKVMDDLKAIGDRWRPYVVALTGAQACQTPAAQGDAPR